MINCSGKSGAVTSEITSSTYEFLSASRDGRWLNQEEDREATAIEKKGNSDSRNPRPELSILQLCLSGRKAFTHSRVTDLPALDFISLLFLVYAVIVTFSAALQLFQTARIYNAKASIPFAVNRPSAPTRGRQRKSRRLQNIR
jgi:hypothetical protein